MIEIENANPEVWRPVKGLEGIYEISNYGSVMSYNYYHRNVPKLLKSYLTGHGYLRICLSYKRTIIQKHIATLVAEAFLPNPDNLPQVNHKDENKTNNFVWVNEDGTIDPERSNLEWCTCQKNVNHGTRNRRMIETRTKLGQIRGEKAVVQLTLDGSFVNAFRSISEAQRKTGAYTSTIAKCCNGVNGKHHGFKWRYLDDYISEKKELNEVLTKLKAQTL